VTTPGLKVLKIPWLPPRFPLVMITGNNAVTGSLAGIGSGGLSSLLLTGPSGTFINQGAGGSLISSAPFGGATTSTVAGPAFASAGPGFGS
jgi:hypothetical protein